MITRIEVKNFRSFDHFAMELRELNLLIGANASGKSNFIEVFKFIRDFVDTDLKNAVSLQGGEKYFKNFNKKDDESFFKIEFRFDEELEGEKILIKTIRDTYQPTKALYEINFNKVRNLQGCEQNISLYFEQLSTKKIFQLVIEPSEKSFIVVNKEDLEQQVNDLIEYFIPENFNSSSIFYPEEVKTHSILPKLLVSSKFIFLEKFYNTLKNLRVFNIDPQSIKKGNPIYGKAYLEENANNLTVVIKNLFENNEKKEEFLQVISLVLPYIKDIDTEVTWDSSIVLKIKEKFFERNFIPAHLISDGTVNLIALILILFFDERMLTIIEEPDRNVHPKLISAIMELLKETSKEKQLILSTHNPLLLRYVDLDKVIYFSRDKNGYTIPQRLIEKERIEEFCKGELGVDELFIQDLFEVI